MRWNHWIRQSHRWLSVLFTLTVVGNFAMRLQGEPSAWVTYAAAATAVFDAVQWALPLCAALRRPRCGNASTPAQARRAGLTASLANRSRSTAAGGRSLLRNGDDVGPRVAI